MDVLRDIIAGHDDPTCDRCLAEIEQLANNFRFEGKLSRCEALSDLRVAQQRIADLKNDAYLDSDEYLKLCDKNYKLEVQMGIRKDEFDLVKNGHING